MNLVAPLTAEEAEEVQEQLGAIAARIVALEVTVKEFIRRLDTDVTPRHSDHESRLRLAEIALTEMRVRVALVSTAVGTGSGVVAGVASALLVRLIGG